MAQPSFEVDEHGANREVHMIKHPSDEDIAGRPSKWLTAELRRRGFLKPPYKLYDAAGSFSVLCLHYLRCSISVFLHSVAYL